MPREHRNDGCGRFRKDSSTNFQITTLDCRMPHAVSRLRTACLTYSATRPHLDRGSPRKERCAECRLIPSHCMCALRPVVPTRAAV